MQKYKFGGSWEFFILYLYFAKIFRTYPNSICFF